MKPFFLKGETQARRRLLQEVLFSYGWGWCHSQQKVMDYPNNYIYVEEKSKHLYNWNLKDASYKTEVIPSEDFLANPENYLKGVITN